MESIARKDVTTIEELQSIPVGQILFAGWFPGSTSVYGNGYNFVVCTTGALYQLDSFRPSPFANGKLDTFRRSAYAVSDTEFLAAVIQRGIDIESHIQLNRKFLKYLATFKDSTTPRFSYLDIRSQYKHHGQEIAINDSLVAHYQALDIDRVSPHHYQGLRLYVGDKFVDVSRAIDFDRYITDLIQVGFEPKICTWTVSQDEQAAKRFESILESPESPGNSFAMERRRAALELFLLQREIVPAEIPQPHARAETMKDTVHHDLADSFPIG